MKPISGVVEMPTTTITETRMVANLDELDDLARDNPGMGPELLGAARRMLRDADGPLLLVRV